MKLLKIKISDAEVANQAGEYKNFTGIIDWKGSKGQVKNADFELQANGDIWWHNGYWVKGIWNRGEWQKGWWENGTWKNGSWLNGKWQNGTWKNGDFNYGTWYDGVWENGDWFGFPEKWKKGTWKNGRIEGKPSKVSPREFEG